MKLLEDIDELLTYLEDTAHGEEGRRITEMRHKILLEQKLQHGVSGKRQDAYYDLFCRLNERIEVKEDEFEELIRMWLHKQDKAKQIQLYQAACASGAVDKTVSGGTINTEGSNKKGWSENDNVSIEM